jgi:competence protein ComEA
MFKRLLAALFALIAATAFAAVDINKATQAELETVKGIGPAIAGKMLDERKKSPFKDWADMVSRVKGVGEGNAAKFSTEGLTVNGQAFNKSAAAPAAAKTADKPAATADKPAKADEKADKNAAKKAEKAAKAEAAASATPAAKK